MPNYQFSIRGKITLGYYAIIAIIVGLSVFTFVELRFLEKKIRFREAISEFFDATLEIRRFEKNFFLYGKLSDYEENISYLEKTKELLKNNEKEFETIASSQQIAGLNNNINKYKGLMDEYSAKIKNKHSKSELPVLEQEIRRLGKDIIAIAEDISRSEQKHLQSFLSGLQKILILSIIFLTISGIVMGQALSRMVVKPLKLLEDSMELIADGGFEKIHINSKDREIISLTNAFNKMLKELELRQRHLVQSEKLASLGTLLAGVAHELNNPLSNISSSSQILIEEMRESQGSRGKGQEEGKLAPLPLPLDANFIMELLSQINEQTDRAKNIVHSLLEFSRDSGFKKERLQLRKLLEETIRFIKSHAPANVDIKLDVPDEITILADKQRMQQAFLNLIKNAIEAVVKEGQISISAKRHSAIEKVEEEKEKEIYRDIKYHGKCLIEEDTVDIEIKDTGHGIPQDVLPKIFDPFFTTKDVGKGSGLGLFIVHEIIEEHDGCIAVDSAAGKGTTFLIRLPVK